MYKSDSPFEAFTLAQTIKSCISDVTVWVVYNKLQLNDDRTEIFLLGFAPGIDLPSSLWWVRVTSNFPVQPVTFF